MLLRNALDARSTPLSSINNPNVPLYQALTGMMDGAPVASGVTVTQESGMRVMAVLACVRLIAETIASLPLKVYSGQGTNRVELHEPSEAYIWNQPNPDQTPQVFWEQSLGAALTDGNAFINTARTQAGTIGELHPVNPNTVRIDRTRAGEIVYEVAGDKTHTRETITHVPAFSLPGQLRGLSPIGQARQAIGLSLAAEEFGARLFGNGTNLGGVITADGAISEDVAKSWKARWREMYGGLSKAHEIAVLGNGARFQSLTMPPEDAQFLETRRFQLSEIARLYRVPPHLIADVDRSTSWGAGIEEQNIAFIAYTLLSWARRFEQAISTRLLPMPNRYARWEFTGLLRGDSKARNDSYRIGRTNGWLSINDVRRLEEMPPIEGPGGDDYHLPVFVAPIASVLAKNEADIAKTLADAEGTNQASDAAGERALLQSLLMRLEETHVSSNGAS